MGFPILAACLLSSSLQVAVEQVASARLRTLLSGEFKEERIILIAAAPRSLGLYKRLLDAPDAPAMHIVGLYFVIGSSNVDGRHFLTTASRHLTHSEVSVRSSAAGFIGKMGTAADSAPLVVLLSDPSGSVTSAAARALGKIGDDRTVVALDLWLQYNRVPGDRLRGMPHVTKARDEIKARLAAQAKDAAGPSVPTAPPLSPPATGTPPPASPPAAAGRPPP